MAAKKKTKVPRKTNPTTEKLAKSGDTLDMAPVVKQFAAAELQSVDEMKKSVADIEEIQRTSDRPTPKRWRGDRGPLTIASPGDIVDDPTYIPEYVTLADGTSRHVCNHRIIDGQLSVLTADSRRKFRWCRLDAERRKIALHQRRGFEYARYSKLFAGTGLFTSGPADTVQNGDLLLMSISIDAWEKMKAEKKRLQDALEGSEGNELFAQGQQYGVPTFKDNMKTGQREFYT